MDNKIKLITMYNTNKYNTNKYNTIQNKITPYIVLLIQITILILIN